MIEIIQQISISIEIPSKPYITACSIHMYNGFEKAVDYSIVRQNDEFVEYTNERRISVHNLVWVRLKRGSYGYYVNKRDTNKG